MRDLCCGRCSKRLIEDFWVMVEAETTPMFATFSLTCDCGARIRVTPKPRSRWVRLPEATDHLVRHA